MGVPRCAQPSPAQRHRHRHVPSRCTPLPLLQPTTASLASTRPSCATSATTWTQRQRQARAERLMQAPAEARSEPDELSSDRPAHARIVQHASHAHACSNPPTNDVAAVPVDEGQAAEFGGLLGACLQRAAHAGLDVAINVSASDCWALACRLFCVLPARLSTGWVRGAPSLSPHHPQSLLPPPGRCIWTTAVSRAGGATRLLSTLCRSTGEEAKQAGRGGCALGSPGWRSRLMAPPAAPLPLLCYNIATQRFHLLQCRAGPHRGCAQ